MKNIREFFGDIDIYLFDQIQKGRFDPRMKILDAGCGGGHPFSNTYPEVWIMKDDDLERGQIVVRHYEDSPVEAGVVFCRACGEENPRNFQLCWQCGAGLESVK